MGKKAPPPPPPPDYVALAKQQAELDREAVDRQTMANRVDQVTTEGSLKWSQDPATGRWTQTQTLSPELQAAREQQQKVQRGLSDTAGGLLGNAQAAVKDPFSMEGMTEVAGYNPAATPTTEGLADQRAIDESKLGEYGKLDYSGAEQLGDSGFGAVEGVRSAMMSRMQPALAQARDREIQRLKAQGYTEGSKGFMRAQQLQGMRENDAEQQALLGAAGEYGNIFNRKLAARQQGVSEADKQAAYANQLRGQQLSEQDLLANRQNVNREAGLAERFQLANAENARQQQIRGASQDDRSRQMQEALMMRQMPLNELNAFMSGGQIENPNFEDFKGSGLAGAPDLMGATSQSYKAQMDAINAKNAKKGGAMSGILGLAGTVVGGIYGGPAGAAVGGAAGNYLGEAMG